MIKRAGLMYKRWVMYGGSWQADEIEDEPEGESIANIKLSAAEEAIVQTIAMHTKKPADDIRAEFIKNKAKRA